MRRLPPLTFLALLIPATALAAAIFPDVPDGHMFQRDIESLVRAGVVHGNPDGKFYPDRVVNRAEMLKMLYLASGRTPDGTAVKCFTDVAPGSWYEIYVCDASKHNFIQGYGDKTFKPEQQVNRVEALKMLFQVMELPAPSITEKDRDVIKFVDLSVSAWYTRYIYAAFVEGILPVAGMDSARFEPEKGLTRGEAAAYIQSAIELDLAQRRLQKQSSSSSSVSSDADLAITKYVNFPFTDEGKFVKKKQMSLLFTLSDRKTLGEFTTKITGAISSDVTCRLYRLRDDGFSEEYYLGTQAKGSCTIRAALPAGNYQLQLQPTVPDTYYSVVAKTVTGDGNDGFMEAQPLSRNAPKTEILGANDIYDWYTFTVPEGGLHAVIETSSSFKIGCVIYTPLSVDQFGFTGPQCNEYYDYAEGTYTIGLVHRDPIEHAQTYTVRLRY